MDIILSQNYAEAAAVNPIVSRYRPRWTFGAIIASVAVYLAGIDLPVIGANIAVGVGVAALILVVIADKVSQVANVGVNVLATVS